MLHISVLKEANNVRMVCDCVCEVWGVCLQKCQEERGGEVEDGSFYFYGAWILL